MTITLTANSLANILLSYPATQSENGADYSQVACTGVKATAILKVEPDSRRYAE